MFYGILAGGSARSFFAYLARFFRVRVLGHPHCNDEEGLPYKPFQMAACGAEMIPIERNGLLDCFASGEEVLAFLTPREAPDAVTALLDDRERREAMAFAACHRVIRDHTWDRRLVHIFRVVGLPLGVAG